MKPSKSRGAPQPGLGECRAPAESENRAARFKRRKPYLAAALALFLLTLLAFSNSFNGGFVLDNRGLILNDPRLRDATAANLHLILQHTYWWPTGEGGVYRPFTTLTYLFNYAILGNRDRPGGYHWINFLLHGGNALLVYALAVRFIRRFWPSFFIAAMWAVHPVLTEAVTNIVGRADLLAATGLLGGFLIYLNSVEASGARRWAWLAGLAALTAIGVFSKENAVVIPAVIVLYELAFLSERQWNGKALTGLLATGIPIALMFYRRSVVLAASLPKEVPFTDNPILGASFWKGRLTAIEVLAHYLWLMVWPAKLSADYSWSEIPIAHVSFADWIALVVVLTLIPAMVFLYRRNRGAFFIACFTLAWMAPVSNLLFPIGSIMAERFLYVPLLGFVACLVLGIYALAERVRKPVYAPALLGFLAVALIARTWVRNSDWQNDLRMATASVRSSPNSFKSHDLLANVLFASDPSHANLDRVIEESEKSLIILDPLPDNRNVPDPYQLAGTCYLYRGDYRKSIVALLRFLAIEKAEFAEFKRKLKPGGPSAQSAERITATRQGDVYTLLSMAYLRSGDTNDASDAAAHAGALNPLSSQLYRQRAEIAIANGKTDEAAATLVEGAFVMSDGSLRQRLVELYRKTGGPASCALIPGPRGLALNPACPVVHSDLCAAAAGTIGTLARTGQSELAETRKKMFAMEFGCPETR